MLLGLPTTVPQTASAQDLMSDTWVGTDDLGRTMPTAEECPLKEDEKRRTVGIFYVTWHTPDHHNGLDYRADVTKVLATDSAAARSWDNPAWSGPSYHWGEPEYGYFLSKDKYVIRHDMSMLADAGVDVIIFDVTNAVCYWDEWDTVLETMCEMKREGQQVPKFCFWAFNGNVITVVEEIYKRYYKHGKEEYEDLQFTWDGKPLLLYNATPSVDANVGGGEKNLKDYSKEVKEFFTLRNMWWGYYEWAGQRFVGTEDNWSFGFDLGDERVASLTPEELCAKHEGRMEQMAVTPAQHPISTIGKSWRRETKEPPLNAIDMPARAYVPATGREEEDPVRYGIYFQDRWDEALQVDPDFIYLNDWNEWTAGRYVSGKDPGGNVPGPDGFLGRKNPFYFVDQYNAEFNRTIQPMRGGYTDNYYMQMVQNIRRYKGVRQLPTHSPTKGMKVDGKFEDWNEVEAIYRDTPGDVIHRNHPGYGNLVYTDSTGRNDIILSKVAVDKRNLYFYVETDDTLSPETDKNWMLLFIDADQNPATGWHGYDFVVNALTHRNGQSLMMRYDDTHARWDDTDVCLVHYARGEKQMELSLPRDWMGLKGKHIAFDFKWADNPTSLDDIITLCTTGDTAPNRRFAYRYKGIGK